MNGVIISGCLETRTKLLMSAQGARVNNGEAKEKGETSNGSVCASTATSSR